MTIQEFEIRSAQEILQWASAEFADKVVIASSFGMEDMVLIDMNSKLDQPIKLFTLDTGRLHEETYEIMERVRAQYGLKINIFFPNKESVQNLVRQKGFFSFRESLENRKECCNIRKVQPLKQALQGQRAWVTGLRREQAITRTEILKVEKDLEHPPLTKINPISDWTKDQVEMYIKKYQVPINALHKKNFLSIGCAPCTRAVNPGEDIRSGRWWWENPEQKECGLHRS